MKLNRKVLGAAVAVALLSTSALAVAPFGNTTQRGSLLIYPRIEVNPGVSDTLIRMINDYGFASVQLKCYYLAPGDNYSSKKYVKDFGKTLTSNQPVYWWASSGKTVPTGTTGGTRVIPVGFSPFPPLAGGTGSVPKTAGELKCWAVGAGGLPIHFNHLSGLASIVKGSQAAEYTAFAFEAIDGDRSTANTNKVLTQPADTALLPGDAELLLDGKMYDSCPVQLLTSYFPAAKTQLTVVGCNQDLRQDRATWPTKLNYTFWDADENPSGGWYECADSWHERLLSDIEGSLLDSPIAYVRFYGAPSTVCTAPTYNAGLLGITIESETDDSRMRGTNMTGRGEYTGGFIRYNVTNNSGSPAP